MNISYEFSNLKLEFLLNKNLEVGLLNQFFFNE